MAQISSQTPGDAPYVIDDTRNWAESYRVGNKIKPAFVLRAATDSNWINNQFMSLPGYGGRQVFCQSISNIISPGQRIGGCLSWQVTESLDNVVQAAELTILDALPLSLINTTASNYYVGTGNPQFVSRGYDQNSRITKGPTGVTAASSIYGSNIMPAHWFSTTIRYQWVMSGVGNSSVQLVGNAPINTYFDPSLAHNDPNTTRQYQEENVAYRQFEPEVIQVADISQFPNPAVPAAENEAAFNQLGAQYDPTTAGFEWWDVDTTGSLKGVGAFYILVDQEVMRVTRVDIANSYLFIPPGGRGVAGAISQHSVGAPVTLLGFPPFTGQWTGLGYLMPTDFKINQSPMRTGNCYVSYEGYGNPGDYKANGTGPFAPQSLTNASVAPFTSKQFDRNNNMCFTGYWFVNSPGVTLDDTGVPQLTVSLQSSGYLLDEQLIDPINVSRATLIYYSWAQATFDAIGYNRKMAGDWYDFNFWESDKPGAYPLTISTEYAQNQDFLNHMADTNNGTTCEFCQLEWWEYVQAHEHGKPTGSIAESRQVGKHIYHESIRVFNLGGQFNAGPLKTYGRLMHALAMAAWDNPQIGDTLASRWTKIPNLLFDNLKNFTSGRCWNGQLAYDFPGSATYDYIYSTYDDRWVNGNRIPLKCPFKSQYDRQPWSQPMQDLASMNRMTYAISREGFPIFIPVGKKLRGIPNPSISNTPGGWFLDGAKHECADNDSGLGEWHLSYGGSIDSYTHTIDPSGVLTLVYVSCSTAFSEFTFTIGAAGTGVGVHYNAAGQQTNEQLIQYSNQIGNKTGLQLTSGAQQTDAVSLDNLFLGLDWNTQPQSWGLTVIRGGDQVLQVNAQPPIANPKGYKIYLDSDDARNHPEIVKKIAKCCNFFIQRRYIGAPTYDQYGKVFYISGFLSENGEFHGSDGLALKDAISKLQLFLAIQLSSFNSVGGKYVYTTPSGQKIAGDEPGVWGKGTYYATKFWIDKSAEYIKTDIWWYVENGSSWDEYVAAIVGLNIPQIPSNSGGDGSSTLWQIDQNALKTEADQWMKQFFQDAVTYGNSIVDDSINKASQKVINCNLADPRIQLGDVVWANVPGYLDTSNAFGQKVSPFLNGVYITGITRSLDLQQGTYSASYQGYRYRGNFEDNVTMNISNYCSTKANNV